MKKLLLSFLAFLTVFTAKATVHSVSIENNAFSPNAIIVELGDTIRWTLVNGVHNVTSSTVPSGVAAFNSPTLSTAGVTYEYKVTMGGTYTYFCSIHGASMAGGFFVSNTAGISKASKSTELKAYPNPFKTKISIPNKNAESIEIFSVLGEKVKTVDVSTFDKTTTIDLSDLRKGVYFYALKDASGVLETRKIVKSE